MINYERNSICKSRINAAGRGCGLQLKALQFWNPDIHAKHIPSAHRFISRSRDRNLGPRSLITLIDCVIPGPTLRAVVAGSSQKLYGSRILTPMRNLYQTLAHSRSSLEIAISAALGPWGDLELMIHFAAIQSRSPGRSVKSGG